MRHYNEPMNARDPQATRVQHVMDMLRKPIVMTTPQYTVSNTLPNRGYRRLPMTEVLTIMKHCGAEAVLGLRSLTHTYNIPKSVQVPLTQFESGDVGASVST